MADAESRLGVAPDAPSGGTEAANAEGSFAYIVENAQAREIAPDDAHGAARGDGSLLWLHLHGPDEQAPAWLSLNGDVPDPALAALVAAETRPRCEQMGDGALVNLRGVGDAAMRSTDPLNSIRLWMGKGRVVSATRARVDALATVRGAVKAGRVTDPGELVAVLAGAISKQLDKVIAEVGDRLDDVEETLAADEGADLRRDTNAIRAQAIGFRRFVAPERVALTAVAELPCDWLDDRDRTDIREAANRFARMTEELDAIRDRAALVSEQLGEARAALLERRSFVLSIVALIFLPLTFFTGLLGINVKGIWYADRPWAFNGVVIICVATAALLSGFFFIRHWFRR